MPGTVASGVMRSGDDVVVLPIGKATRITAIEGPNGPVAEAFPPMAVSIKLADEIDISRGDLIARHNQPRSTSRPQCVDGESAALERRTVASNTPRTRQPSGQRAGCRLDAQHPAPRQDRNGIETQ